MIKYLVPTLFLFVGCGAAPVAVWPTEINPRSNGPINAAPSMGSLVVHAPIAVATPPPTVPVRSYDPASPDRQDARSLCEMPVSCDNGTGPSVSLPFSQCTAQRAAWNEHGYSLWIILNRPPAGLTRLHIAPQLRAGEPTDRFRVTIRRLFQDDGPPLLVLEGSGDALELNGFTINVAPPTTGAWEAEHVRVSIDFVDPVGFRSRALQWALPPGSVTNADTHENLIPCLQVGQYMDTPDHGILHLTEDGTTGEPQCSGTVRRLDSIPTPYPEGLIRSETRPRLYYASSRSAPQLLIIRFETLREFSSWIKTPDHPSTICANVLVLPDAMLLQLLTTWTNEAVGSRPGSPVSWLDGTSLRTHFGIADRRWTIRDIGTDSDAILSNFECGPYNTYTGRTDSDCWVDLQNRITSYTIVPANPAAIDPQAIDAASGFLLGYNHNIRH